MEKKTAYCLLFLVLLVPYTALGAVLKRAPAKKEKRAVPLAVPLVYWGASVSPAVWNWLLVTFGAAAVAAAAVTVSDNDSHSCANNRGWCRSRCFSHEYIDSWHSDVCGSYDCCRPRY
uniref:Big defensin n=1 Tax=Branchiostoma belcheri TaxID=7741 RepID=BDEF_BRABE|nr:RecName: Full=Big defensin; AltName: Full=Defensin; Flags: Precursor [Branchiostoma belcheri]AAO18674.1 defensin [Branchiostoma belcheri tsingtauense]